MLELPDGEAQERLVDTSHGLWQEFILRMAEQSQTLQLRQEDIAYLLTLLKNSTSPLTTQALVDAYKQRVS